MTGRSRRTLGSLFFLVVVFSVLGFFYWRARLEKSTLVRTSEQVGPPGLYPDSSTTFGATDPRVSQGNIGETICVSGWSKGVRPPPYVTNSIKSEMMTPRGLTDLSAYELDHFSGSKVN